MKQGSKQYPVHFSSSNTSGEKPFEEFYTDTEKVDMDRLNALGVIVDKELTDRDKIEKLFTELNYEFGKMEPTKREVVQIIKDYIETGKSLDSKM